uniref:Uncharacterized protein n=1 Tax=Rhodnius prolixus TaxID=13249 RepID=T1I3H6_RHOPR
MDSFPAVPHLKIWTNSEGIKLIGWHTSHIYVCSLSKEQILKPMESPKLHCCYEELVASEDIVEVFCVEDKCYVVDSRCFLLEIVREVVPDMEWEGDLFEESPKRVLKSYLKKVHRIYENSTLQAACLLSEESFAFLINTQISVIAKIINLKTFKETKCFTVRSTPLMMTPQHDVEEIELAYIRNWFPEEQLDNFQSGLLVISLPESIICGVLLDENRLTPHFMFSWPFQAVKANWCCTVSKEPNRIARKSNLILVFDGGTVAILEQYGCRKFYMPSNRIRNALISPEFVVTTDYFECYASNTFEANKIIKLPVRDVLGMCTIPEQKHIIFATTKHRTLYAIDLNAKIENYTFKMPDKGIFDEFLRKNKYLEQLNKQLEEKDNYINALSYSLNNSVMKFSLSVQVVLIAGLSHTFRIIIKSENPGIIFRNTIWKVHLTLLTNDCCFTFVRNLEHDLAVNNPFVDFISLVNEGNYWDYLVDANLICYIGKDKYRPHLNIGNVAYSLKLYQSNVEREVNIEEILENISKNDHNTHLKKNEEKSSCSFEVPINEELPVNCIVKTLLSNCRALWRYSEWEEICKKTKFQIFISGNLFNIEIKKNTLMISGKHAESCHSLKVAALQLLNKNWTLNIDNTLQLKVEDLLQSLEILQLAKEDNAEAKLSKTLAIYKQLKENIVFPLTGVKMNLSSDLFENKNLLKDGK